MLYKVTIYTANRFERCYDAGRTYTVGTLTAARLCAAAQLPVVYETDYSARMTRMPYAEITRLTGREYDFSHNGLVETIDSTIRFVPSVGELGCTP